MSTPDRSTIHDSRATSDKRRATKSVWLILLSALLLILSYPNFNLEFLAWIGLVPLLFAIDGKRPSRAFLSSYLTGILFFLGTIYWLIHVTLPGMIAVCFWQGAYFGLFGLAISFAFRSTIHDPRSTSDKRRATSYSLLIILPAAWSALEWMRSNGMFGFGWNLLGYSQSFTLPIIQIADITGVYGVSFFVAMVNVAIFLTLRRLIRKEPFEHYLGVVLVLAICIVIYGNYRLNNIFTGRILKVAVVQGNIPQYRKWDANFRDEIIRTYERLTKEVAAVKPDLIIWPETAVPGFIEDEEDLRTRTQALAVDAGIPMLVGAPREDPAIKYSYYNSAFLLSAKGEIAARYDKVHLVPFGEYIPFRKVFSFVQRFSTMPIGDFSAGADYTIFTVPLVRSFTDGPDLKITRKNVRFSVLICFEDIFADLTRQFAKRGVNFLVNMTNDAWFKETSAPYQHAQASIFRAVENRTSVIRAANTGLSCVIDQKGRMIDVVRKGDRQIFVEGYLTSDIVLSRTQTFYTQYGDIFSYICLILSALFVLSFAVARQRGVER